MSFFKSVTRGGQLNLHNLRMMRQVMGVCFLISLFISLFYGGLKVYTQVPGYVLAQYYQSYKAETLLLMSSRTRHPHLFVNFTNRDGRVIRIRAKDLASSPYIHQMRTRFHGIVWKALQESLLLVLGISLFLLGFWGIKGLLSRKKTHERGGKLASPTHLQARIRMLRQGSDLTLDGLPLIKNKETAHILVTGTSGSGKTNCFHTLLPQIRKRPNRAIVVDMTGDFVARYFRQGKDVILNPLDHRSEHWSPWADCRETAHYDALAAAIVPKSAHLDHFWENAGKALLSSALKELRERGEEDVQKLYRILVRDNLVKFSKFFQNTDAATYTHTDGEKMTLSIRATLANALQSFKYLQATEKGFSIRDWVSEDKGDQWLFLTARPDQRETLRPLMTGWLDTAINALMTLPPDSQRRLWFIVDELPSLQKLSSLRTIMAEGRKYGGCVLAGVQNFPQVSDVYGQNHAQSLLDLFNTKVFFRNTDPNTTSWISKVLGEAETTEHVENLSYGAHTMRDGISLSTQTRTKPLVIPTEIAELKDLQAYIRLPGTYPVTKLKMKYKSNPVIAPAFDLLNDEELKKRQLVLEIQEDKVPLMNQEERKTQNE